MVMSKLGGCQKWSWDGICGSQIQEATWLVNLGELQVEKSKTEEGMRVNLLLAFEINICK